MKRGGPSMLAVIKSQSRGGLPGVHRYGFACHNLNCTSMLPPKNRKQQRSFDRSGPKTAQINNTNTSANHAPEEKHDVQRATGGTPDQRHFSTTSHNKAPNATTLIMTTTDNDAIPTSPARAITNSSRDIVAGDAKYTP